MKAPKLAERGLRSSSFCPDAASVANTLASLFFGSISKMRFTSVGETPQVAFIN